MSLGETIVNLPAQVFNAAEAADARFGVRELRRLRQGYAIDRIGRCLYRNADLPPANLDSIEIVARRPDATLCLTSSLAHYGLIGAIPARINLALPVAPGSLALRPR